jgi:hypothetical protein
LCLIQNPAVIVELYDAEVDIWIIIACNRQLDLGQRRFDQEIFRYGLPHIMYVMHSVPYLVFTYISSDLRSKNDDDKYNRMARMINAGIFKFMARTSVIVAVESDTFNYAGQSSTTGCIRNTDNSDIEVYCAVFLTLTQNVSGL